MEKTEKMKGKAGGARPGLPWRHAAAAAALALAAAAPSGAQPPGEGFERLAARCAPQVHPGTMRAIAAAESGFNPYAIGVVGGSVAQPRSLAEAMQAVARLEEEGRSYSLGIAQVSRANLKRFGIPAERAFDACTNLAAAARILGECWERAGRGRSLPSSLKDPAPGEALGDALSCYYSGNFRTGWEHGYVSRVMKGATPGSDPGPGLLVTHDGGRAAALP